MGKGEQMKKVNWLFVASLIMQGMVIAMFTVQLWFHLVIPAIMGAICVLVTSWSNLSTYVRIKVSQAMLKESCERLQAIYERELTDLVSEMEIPTA